MGIDPSFVRGLMRGVALLRTETPETVSHLPEYDATAFGRGLFAACEASNGWMDLAEREACAFGASRSDAEVLIHAAMFELREGKPLSVQAWFDSLTSAR